MTQAGTEWRRLYNAGDIQNPDVFKAWKPPGWVPTWVPVPMILEKTFDDGSILRWSDRQNRWTFYVTKDELTWAKHLGRA